METTENTDGMLITCPWASRKSLKQTYQDNCDDIFYYWCNDNGPYRTPLFLNPYRHIQSGLIVKNMDCKRIFIFHQYGSLFT